MPLVASRHRGLSKNWKRASSCGTATGKFIQCKPEAQSARCGPVRLAGDDNQIGATMRGGIYPPHFQPLLRTVWEYHRSRDISSIFGLDIGGGNVRETEAHSELEMARILPKTFAAGDSVRCCRRGR